MEAALAAQRKATSDAQNQLVTAERYFMAAEKSLARCAEGLEDTIQSKKDMDQYDTMK